MISPEIFQILWFHGGVFIPHCGKSRAGRDGFALGAGSLKRCVCVRHRPLLLLLVDTLMETHMWS